MRHDHPMKPATPDACCCGPEVSPAPAPSRRALLTASAGLAAGAAALPFLSDSARAQAAGANADGLLARVQGQRRILLKGGVVLTLDRSIGDFAQADVLIEDGKIREVRPSVAISSDDAAVIDATNRIVVPGFIDTHHHFYQGLLRSILTNGLLNPDYSRDIGNTLTPAYAPADAYAGVLVTALGMIDMGTTTAVDTSQVSHTPEHSDACIRALQESGMRAVCLLARQWTRYALPARHHEAAADIFQLAGPVAHARAGRTVGCQGLRLCARGRRALRLPWREQQHRAHAARTRARRAAAAGR